MAEDEVADLLYKWGFTEEMQSDLRVDAGIARMGIDLRLGLHDPK